MLLEFFSLWDRVSTVELHTTSTDMVAWAWEKDGSFSTRSSYVAKFWGREVFPTTDFTWKSRTPLQCWFFSLALKNRCWTSDRLARRGLPHEDSCPYCAQHEESINHILLDCVFARHVWSTVCTTLCSPEWVPSVDAILTNWCINKPNSCHSSKDLRVIITLGMSTL